MQKEKGGGLTTPSPRGWGEEGGGSKPPSLLKRIPEKGGGLPIGLFFGARG